MRVRKQQRQTDEGGIPNGPPRPSIEAVKGAIEQLSPRDRWLVALWMRTIYVQRPPPAQPQRVREPGVMTISKEEFEARLLAQVNEGRAKRGYPLIEDWQVKSRQRPRKKAKR